MSVLDDLRFTPSQAVRLMAHAIRHPEDVTVAVALAATLHCGAEPSEVVGHAIIMAPEASPWLVFALMRRLGHLEVVLQILNDRRVEVRRVAAEALEFVQDRRVIQPLSDRAAHDEDAAVRGAAQKAVDVLRSQRDGPSRSIPFPGTHATRALAALLLEETPEISGLVEVVNGVAPVPEMLKPHIRRIAAQVFSADVDALIAALPVGNEQLSIEMIRVLGEVGDPRLAVFVARQYHAGVGQNMEEAIADALGAITGPLAAEFLARMLDIAAGQHTTDVLRTFGATAGQVLLPLYAAPGRIRSEHAGLLAELAGAEALDALVEALSDDSSKVRRGAEGAVPLLGSVATDPLIRVVQSGTPIARPHAIMALAAIADVRASALLLRLAEPGNDVGYAAIAALGSFAGAASLGKLAGFVLADDERARLSAIEGLGRIQDARAIPLLGIAASDDRRTLRIAAARALACTVARNRDSQAVRLLLRLADDDDPLVGRAAAAELATIPDREALIGSDTDGTRHIITKRMWEAETALRRPSLVLYAHGPSRDSASQAKPVLTDAVFFSTVAPAGVAAGESFVLDLWAHREELRISAIEAVRQARCREVSATTKGPAQVDRATTLLARLSIPDLSVSQMEDTILWTGTMGNASFPITVLPDVSPGVHLGSFMIFVGPLLVSRLHFELRVLDKRGHAMPALIDATVAETRLRTAFASYAAEDREHVLARLQGILKVLPDLDVFLDVLSLRSGDDWAARIREEIRARDVFYLFWSVAASQSTWVEMEWRTALAERGRDYIDPVPLEPASLAPPPTELAGLHFGDWTMMVGPQA